MENKYKHGIYAVVLPNKFVVVKATSPPASDSPPILLKSADGLLLKTSDGFYLAVRKI